MEFKASTMRMWSRLGPSGALGAAAMELGEQDEDIVFVSADMTFAAGLERFKNKYPERHFEVGIAEQNLIGVASGLANEGFNPFAVTYATFFATRALDQVKMCLGYMKQPVKMIGINAGFATGILGPTHMALEDVAAMRAIPNMTIVSPADTTETVKALLMAAEWKTPLFIRLTGEMNQPQIYHEDYDFEIGKAIKLKDGKDIVIIGAGAVLFSCIQAAESLEEQGISCGVINMHTIKPLDKTAIDEAVSAKLIVTVEEHSCVGGLGGAVAEYLSRYKDAPVLQMIGVDDRYPHSGSYQALMKECGLDREGIEQSIIDYYRKVTE